MYDIINTEREGQTMKAEIKIIFSLRLWSEEPDEYDNMADIVKYVAYKYGCNKTSIMVYPIKDSIGYPLYADNKMVGHMALTPKIEVI